MLKELKASLMSTNDQNGEVQSTMNRLVDKNPASLEEALSDNGVINRNACLNWLKNKIKENVAQGYCDYIPAEADELREVAENDDRWWVINAYERVEHLNASTVMAIIDEIDDD